MLVRMQAKSIQGSTIHSAVIRPVMLIHQVVSTLFLVDQPVYPTLLGITILFLAVPAAAALAGIERSSPPEREGQ